jgi:hypothetical protein
MVAYLSSMPQRLANMRMKLVATEVQNEIRFGWAGGFGKRCTALLPHTGKNIPDRNLIIHKTTPTIFTWSGVISTGIYKRRPVDREHYEHDHQH